MGDYRKLAVWQRARALTRRIQVLTTELPKNESERADQIKRAATSIRYNIADGAGFNSDALFARHVRYSLASANELQDELLDLDDVGLLNDRDRDLEADIVEIRSMLVGLYRTLTSGDSPPPTPRRNHPRKRLR